MTTQPLISVPQYVAAFPKFGPLGVELPEGMFDVTTAADVCPTFALLDDSGDTGTPIVTLRIHAPGKSPDRSGRFELLRGAGASVELATDHWPAIVELIDAFRPFAGLEVDGMWIVNPTCCDGGGRFEASPAEYGFAVVPTGGGLTGWSRMLPNGGHLLLTDFSGTTHDLGQVGETYLIGVYGADGEQLSLHHSVVGAFGPASAQSEVRGSSSDLHRPGTRVGPGTPTIVALGDELFLSRFALTNGITSVKAGEVVGSRITPSGYQFSCELGVDIHRTWDQAARAARAEVHAKIQQLERELDTHKAMRFSPGDCHR